MSPNHNNRLRFNFGFLLDAGMGTTHRMALDYPEIIIDSELTLTPVVGEFSATRTSNGIYIQGILHSQFPTTCSRCLIDIDNPIKIMLDDLFYFHNTAPEGEFEVSKDGTIILTALVREMSLLGIPMQPFCQEDCAGLCIKCGENLNAGICTCQIDFIDPRLAALKELL